jgi:membrane protein DedA with SNARE-associated domain
MSHLATLIETQGYWVVATIVALESMGIPAPGETALVTAAIYAGTTHHLNIIALIAAAAAGAIVGDNIGYSIGRRIGYALLLRHGVVVGLDERRLKLGQFLFMRHGGKVVFFGRFIAVLRALAALLAGITCMDWRRFFLFNATGGVVWAAAYGAGAYLFGGQIHRLRGSAAAISIALAIVAVTLMVWWVRGHQSALQAEAERALPGPLKPR